ncbi:amidohydrolase [Roseomonas eburnea]|uniref:Amidohydrolase n=1 Tax=Neoroseomonas eburnea TaxID=1346889 RepID=A0A9X9XJ63_9PROT|nr:amidohydrolase [Neoroseomonas eburnea]MBR0683749.1 amidohydrolase [Neoroseomonas eburnea]
MAVLPEIAAGAADMVAWRHRLHAAPEIGFEVHETARFVAGCLRSFGCDRVETGIGGSGVVGVVQGRADGPAVGLRADMDALPIHEDTGLAYGSRHAGRMHACGHDGHTTILLGAARYLCATRRFRGSVVLIFQPAEEIGRGAAAMLGDALLERFPLRRVFGLHNWPGLSEGVVFCREGPVMAAVADLTIGLAGHGGHGGMPHIASDQILAAAHLVVALQGIVARNLPAVEAGVVSIGHVEDTGAWNVLPSEVCLRGTVRWFAPEIGDLLERRIGEVAQAVAGAWNCRCSMEFCRVTPAVMNHPAATLEAEAATREVLGDAGLVLLPAPLMAGDDVGALLAAVPGCYLMLGAGGGPGAMPLHHPRYDFNDGLLPVGASLMARLAERGLDGADGGNA